MENTLISRNVFWSRVPGKFLKRYTGESAGSLLGGDEKEWTQTLLSTIEDESWFFSQRKGILPDNSFLEVGYEVSSYNNINEEIKLGYKVYNLLKSVLGLTEINENDVKYFQHKNGRLLLDETIDPASIILEEKDIGKSIINVTDLL